MKVLVIDDHPLFRFGVVKTLADHWPGATIGEAGSLAQGLELILQQSWDLAITDLNLGDAAGIESVVKLKRVAPEVPLLVVSLKEETPYATRVLEQGAAGYLTKKNAAEELLTAIERIVKGGRYISSSLAEHLADLALGTTPAGARHEQLSPQEYRVMLQLAAGKSLVEISSSMHLSAKTVTTYRARVLEKLGVNSNVAIARYCLEHHLTDEA